MSVNLEIPIVMILQIKSLNKISVGQRSIVGPAEDDGLER